MLLIRKIGSSAIASRPNLHFTLQHELVLLVDFFPDDLDELHHVVGQTPRIGDDEIGVLGADFSAADPQTLQPGLVDQRAGAEAARVFENTAAVLGVEWLAVAF